MALVLLPGEGTLWPWPTPSNVTFTDPSLATFANMNVVNYASIFVGTIRTEDGASHTIDTTGSSSLNFVGATSTFTGGSTLRIGLAAPDTTTTPIRAANAANVISFDVYRDVTAMANNTVYELTPTSGTKTIANGDVVAFAFQMITRLGSDAAAIKLCVSDNTMGFPANTYYNGAVYTGYSTGFPNLCITFSDGTMGFIEGAAAYEASSSTSFNSNSNPNHRGTLFTVPMPCAMAGIQLAGASTGAFQYIVVRDPLGTPVVEATYSYVANMLGFVVGSWNIVRLPTPLILIPNITYGLILRPTTTTNVNIIGITIPTNWRGFSPGGATSYGLTRNGTSGAYTAVPNAKYFLGPILQSVEGLTVPPTYQLAVI